ncbi:aminoacylase-1-like [Haliotis rubra]|uniref:aminoacylase-1-like n=1 Tax=Haliotis rubra TaxID=36100 RepID=UPI001EE5E640|nr:aminoacylase-1-like [Haliotis rubra]
MSEKEDPAVSLFREYLRIPTVHPDPDYSKAIDFISRLADDVGLEFTATETAPKNIFAVMSWVGTNPSLPSLGLYSHIDVVPVFPEHWKVPPFSAEKMENGDIYARGSQDMKCVGIQYVEAIRRLKKEGKRLLRTIHVIFGPDEETGGELGMKVFMKLPESKKLNLGFCLDEGIANPGPEFKVFYAERSCWWVKFRCAGNPGHGSSFIQDSAAEKLTRILNIAMDFRNKQEQRLNSDPSLTIGDVTTLNLTIIKGGVQYNVVPAELFACFDIRTPPHVDLTEFEKELWRWCREAGDDVTLEFDQKSDSPHKVPIDSSNPWWTAFMSACKSLSAEVKTEIFPGGTDSRFLRKSGIPSIGFSPINHTPVLLHDHNEFLNEKIFLRGIDIYYEIIPALANVSDSYKVTM